MVEQLPFIRPLACFNLRIKRFSTKESLVLFLCLLCLMLTNNVSAQADIPTIEDVLANVPADDFFAMQAALNEHYRQYPGSGGETQWRRTEWFLEPRLYPHGKFENLPARALTAYKRYMAQVDQLPHPQQRAPHGGWLFLGPTDWASGGGGNLGLGRINCLSFNPTNDNIMYAGTASGGIWRTLNGGTSWANRSPDIPLLAITDIAIHHTSSAIIYALTGDGDPDPNPGDAHTSPEYASLGVIKTTDGGETWYPTNFFFDWPGTIVPHKMIMHPTNANVMFIAAEQGIYKTDDGWNTWTQVDFGNTYDIEFRPGDPTIMYASRSNLVRKSTTSGDTWSTVTDSDFAIFNTGSRIELAVTPDFPTMVYAAGGDWDNFNGILQSIFEGITDTWIIKDSTTATAGLLGGQGRYNMAIAVKDTDYRDVFLGMVGGIRNYTQGAAGGWTGIAIGHSDIHELQYRNGSLYICNDAGIWKSDNDGTSSTEISKGMAISQIYRISGTPDNLNHYIIGCQDVGHLRRTSASQTFTNIGCCDGMVSIYNYNNINEIYIAGQYGGINKTTTGGPPFTSTGNPGDRGAWITPYIMDPVVPSILFVGKDSVHRSNNSGGSWQYIGSPSTGNLNCMAQGTNDRNKMYVSSSSGIWRTDNALVGSGTATWTSIGAVLPNQFITGIVVDPDNASRVFVSLSGYTSGSKVWMSTNGGTGGAWTNISGSLPNVPVNCIAYHDNGQDGLYIGTDIGVFYRDNTIGDWVYFSNFLPATIVNDLFIHTENSTIAAGTFGRGLWLSSLYSTCPASYNLVGGPVGGTIYYSASNNIESSTEYKPDLGVNIHYTAGNFIDLNEGFEVRSLAFFEGKTGPCPEITDIEPVAESPYAPTGELIIDIDRLRKIENTD